MIGKINLFPEFSGGRKNGEFIAVIDLTLNIKFFKNVPRKFVPV